MLRGLKVLLKNIPLARWWCTLVIPALEEVEEGGSPVQGQPELPKETSKSSAHGSHLQSYLLGRQRLGGSRFQASPGK
jgi:hypothetical protein